MEHPFAYAWKERSLESCDLCAEHERLYEYGIAPHDYNNLLVKQRYVCALCYRQESTRANNGGIRSLSIDHKHQSGTVRGLLCNFCNITWVKGMDTIANLTSDEVRQFLARLLVYCGR